MAEPSVIYATRAGATPEGEINALRDGYDYIRRCTAETEKAAAVTSNDGNDTKEGSRDDFRAKTSIP